MCTGETHVLGGLVAGAAVGTYLLRLPLPGALELTAVAGAFATLPDIDQRGSCCSRGLGFLSGLIARAARRLSGGHRHFTHTLPGAALCAALAWAGSHWRHDLGARAGLALLLALAFAGAGRAVRVRARRMHVHHADLVGVAAGAAMAAGGWGLALVPLGAGVGVLAHIAADGCTDEGIPLLWPLWRGHVKFLPEPLSFTTGTRPEHAFAFALVLALGFLSWHGTGLPLPQLH